MAEFKLYLELYATETTTKPLSPVTPTRKNECSNSKKENAENKELSRKFNQIAIELDLDDEWECDRCCYVSKKPTNMQRISKDDFVSLKS
uniref:Uncharacterized protein n=1 Tax=Glossina palpalis gambiensis TaxID=67801 RepID=A0A1B0BRD3_9MUSC